MKNFLFSLAALSLLCTAVAQEEPDWKTQFPRHEVMIGIGDNTIGSMYGCYSPCLFRGYDYIENRPNWFANNNTYYGDRYTTGSLSFGYMFRVKKWFWVGAAATYLGTYSNVFDRNTDEKIGVQNEHIISLLPYIRFSYLNKKYVTLYSALSIGGVLGVNRDPNCENFFEANLAGQLTAFGITVGKQWFGYTEFGIGMKGFVNAGFGYRFNSKKGGDQ